MSAWNAFVETLLGVEPALVARATLALAVPWWAWGLAVALGVGLVLTILGYRALPRRPLAYRWGGGSVPTGRISDERLALAPGFGQRLLQPAHEVDRQVALVRHAVRRVDPGDLLDALEDLVVRVAASQGVREVVTRRDGPFGDYSQAPESEQPRKRSQIDPSTS